MNTRLVSYLVGNLIALLGAFMLLPLAVALQDHTADAMPFLASAGVTLAVGFLLRGRPVHRDLSLRDAFAVVTFGWLAAGVLGGLPFLFAGTFRSPVDAVFESISGFTTTGATVLADIEAQSRGILLWRGLLQWLGGMGIIVLFVSVFPRLGVGSVQLFRAEMSGLMPEKVVPRMTQTAKRLWQLYVVLSGAQFALLWASGLSWFDALQHTFTGISTGGYSTSDQSVAGLQNPLAEVILTVFMFLGGMNFALQYRLWRHGEIRSLWENTEFWAYLGIALAATGFIAVDLWRNLDATLGVALRKAAFQAVSILTTTGYTSADYSLWPPLSVAILFCLMFLGGSAGSTSGGTKIVRIVLLIKHGFNEVLHVLHPRAVRPLRVGGQVIPEKVFYGVSGFVFLYASIWFISFLVLGLFGLDLVTAASAAIACLGNIGPGFGGVGPAETYAGLPAFVKLYLAFLMIVGRLEVFSVLVLFHPAFWTRPAGRPRTPLPGGRAPSA